MKKLKVGDKVTINSEGLLFLENCNNNNFKEFLMVNKPYYNGYIGYLSTFYNHYASVANSYKNFKQYIKTIDGFNLEIEIVNNYDIENSNNYYYKLKGCDYPIISELINEGYEVLDFVLCQNLLHQISSLNDRNINDNNKIIDMKKLKYKPIKAYDKFGKQAYGYSFGEDYMLKLTENEKFVKIEKTGYPYYLSSDDVIKYFGRVKIKDYLESSSIFGYKLTKKEMFESNKLFKLKRIVKDYESVKTGNKIDIVEVDNGIKTLKFLLSDVEITILEPKGFNEPSRFKITSLKHKADIVNKQVILIRDKNIPVKKSSKGILLDIWTEGSAVKGTRKNGNIRDTTYDKNSKVKVKFENKEIICRFKNIKLIK